MMDNDLTNIIFLGTVNAGFPSPADEDIDLRLRLWAVGPLSYAPVARVLHTFEPDLCAFMRRFVRYGRGNRRLAARYKVDLAPSPFVPHDPSPTNWLLAHMQFLALWWGYHTAWPARGWSMPPSTPAWSTAPPAVVPVHVERLPQQNSPEVHL